MKILLFIIGLALMGSISSLAQTLSYKSGNIFDANNQRLKHTEVEELMHKDATASALYKKGTAKSYWSPILIGAGSGLLISDLILSVTSKKLYPTALTYVGLGSIAISIPISMHKNHKVKKAVDAYNEYIITQKTTLLIQKTSFISNQNGIGMQLTF